MKLSLLLSLVLLSVLSPAHAIQYSPRVLSPYIADTYSLKTFAQFPRWRDLTGDAKVYEIYRYLTDMHTGLYPMGTAAWEGTDVMYEYGSMRDPVKMLNVYPTGYCDTLGPTMEGIMVGMGIGPARTVNIPGYEHVASEIFYHGKWHYLDLDLRGIFRREDGTLASLEEASHELSLYQGPNTPQFFPLDDLDTVRKAYTADNFHYRYGVSTGGHTMDYVLRQGETFTRWWQPQGLRWQHHPSFHEGPFLEILNREPKGPKCKHQGFTIHTHGNGRFVYKPNLTASSTDFEDGKYDARNVHPGNTGLILTKADAGYAIFEVRSPYVIVPEVHDYTTTADDSGASVVQVTGTGVTLSLSLDNGISWQPVAVKHGSVDLTRFVAGRYGYLLKLTLTGKPQQAVVRSLKITTWVQVHPASLPALRKGRNEMRYVTGDHYGLHSRVVEIRPFANNRTEFLKYLSTPPDDYDPARQTARIRGRFVVKVPAPPGTKIAWFSAGGSFLTYQGDDAPKTANTMAYAVNTPQHFTQFYTAHVPAGQSHWHYNADVEVELNALAKTLYLEYNGNPAVNNLRVYAHCVPEKAPSSSSQTIHIMHAWREGGKPHGLRFIVREDTAYTITCEDEPENDYLTIGIPSH